MNFFKSIRKNNIEEKTIENEPLLASKKNEKNWISNQIVQILKVKTMYYDYKKF